MLCYAFAFGKNEPLAKGNIDNSRVKKFVSFKMFFYGKARYGRVKLLQKWEKVEKGTFLVCTVAFFGKRID